MGHIRTITTEMDIADMTLINGVYQIPVEIPIVATKLILVAGALDDEGDLITASAATATFKWAPPNAFPVDTYDLKIGGQLVQYAFNDRTPVVVDDNIATFLRMDVDNVTTEVSLVLKVGVYIG